jgi:hypothetical protein
MNRTLSVIAILFILSFSAACDKDYRSITEFTAADTAGHYPPYVKKPNIYIYPAEKIYLNIQLVFPNGGEIIESEPNYNNGWEIEVSPSGLINDRYNYLFYEARIPELMQKKYGWKIYGPDLGAFFIRNLQSLCFAKNEIDDFTEYWIPLLDPTKTYVIYPQFNDDLEQIIQLKFSVPPDNLIRVIYLIAEYKENLAITAPRIPLFKREEFTVLEWGVIN